MRRPTHVNGIWDMRRPTHVNGIWDMRRLFVVNCLSWVYVTTACVYVSQTVCHVKCSSCVF